LCFGGRGYLSIAADTSGYRDLEGMIEFGGALSFNVAVASGGLYVMAGIHFRITTGSTNIACFFRAGGCLNVLGLIHASVEFLLMASYVRDGSGTTKLAGEASVTVTIDLFLVSFDVTIRMYKEFAGSSGSESPSGGGRLDVGSPWRLVSLAGEKKPAAVANVPYAYFTRPVPAGTTPVLGRFDNPAQWSREYWSQFAL